MAEAVDIELLGKMYRVNCPKGREALLQSARARLETKMLELKQKSRTSSNEQIAVITALNLSYELGEELKRNSDYTVGIDERIQQMQANIDQTLAEQSQEE